MFNKGDLSAGRIAIEVFSIIFAVSIGFAITEWREERAQQERAEAALKSIAKEISRNHLELSRRLLYYETIANTMDSLANIHGDVAFDASDVPGWQGLSPPLPRSASFDISAATGALSYVEFRKVDGIARAYEMQDVLQRTVSNAMESFLAGDMKTYRPWQRTFILFLELGRLTSQAYSTAGQFSLNEYGYAHPDSVKNMNQNSNSSDSE